MHHVMRGCIRTHTGVGQSCICSKSKGHIHIQYLVCTTVSLAAPDPPTWEGGKGRTCTHAREHARACAGIVVRVFK